MKLEKKIRFPSGGHLKLIIVFFAVLCSLLLLFLHFEKKAKATIPESGKVVYSVTFEAVTCVSNNSVGNEWGFAAAVNKKPLSTGESIKKSYNFNKDNFVFVAVAKEDDTIPDVGYRKVYLPVKKMSSVGVAEGTYTVNVEVIENRGRYSGNVAEWSFIFDIEREVSIGEILDVL